MDWLKHLVSGWLHSPAAKQTPKPSRSCRTGGWLLHPVRLHFPTQKQPLLAVGLFTPKDQLWCLLSTRNTFTWVQRMHDRSLN